MAGPLEWWEYSVPYGASCQKDRIRGGWGPRTERKLHGQRGRVMWVLASRVWQFQKHSALELQSEQLAAPYGTQPVHALSFPAWVVWKEKQPCLESDRGAREGGIQGNNTVLSWVVEDDLSERSKAPSVTESKCRLSLDTAASPSAGQSSALLYLRARHQDPAKSERALTSARSADPVRSRHNARAHVCPAPHVHARAPPPTREHPAPWTRRAWFLGLGFTGRYGTFLAFSNHQQRQNGKEN
ncbi:unnamed protein product [Rangifer tarandus platyrhynchus]|uniref:Uncharacterized protein n=2 Tax=Rangifer tarandus platyrhynchus TaxID=3082113 RepID=A0ABN8YCX4_RANTA|nr:unnamed protein product [Rangifer tarandus platyrhynchus]CAI9699779.1 unnamed protein product [Rangifer tarandus platyrhynchus]